MKWIITICIGLLISLEASAKQRIFACEPEWQALAQSLGGDRVSTYSATTAFQDPHHIEPRPSLIAKARRSDLLVCTGAELEIGWLPLLLRQSGNDKIQVGEPGYFLTTSEVKLIDQPEILDRSHGDVHAEGNPHIHWDPYRLLTVAKALAARLETLDPKNATHYQGQLEAFQNQWQSAIKAWELKAQPLQGKKAIVYHSSWRYLLNWLNVDIIGKLEPVPGLPPTSSHLAALLKSARKDKPDFILIANYQNDKSARWLSERAQIPLIKLPYTVGGSDQAKDLQSLYDEALNTLLKQATQ